MMIRKKLAWFVVFAIMAVSCLDDPDCYNLNNNIASISFRKLYDGKNDTVAFISITAAGTDSILAQYALATGIAVPLNFMADQTAVTFEIQNPDGTTRTAMIDLGYTSQVQFVSPDCGERFVLSNLDILNVPEFDSVRLVSRTPADNTGGTHVIIYRCPVLNYVKFGFRQLYADTVSLGVAMSRDVSGITAGYMGTVFYADSTVSTVRLPLNLSDITTTFNFTFDDGTDNSVTLGYDTLLDETLLFKCGPQDLITNLTVPSQDFDGYKVLKDSIQDPPITNVVLFKCPVTNYIRVAFEKADGAADTVTINKITASHMTDMVFAAPVTSVELPLDVNADVSDFMIEFAGGTKNLSLQYTRDQQLLHGICDRTLITDLEVAAHGFTTAPDTVNTNVQFPIVTNIAIVND